MKTKTRRGGELRKLTSGALAALTSLALALALVPGAAVTALAAEVEDAGAAVLKALTSDTVTASGTCGTVTWTLYGDGELVLAPTSGSTGTLESFSGSTSGAPWYGYSSKISSVTVSGTVVCGSNVSQMFRECESLQSVDLSGLDTSSTTDMSFMFFYCSRLRSADLSSLDTSNVTDMSYLFGSCYSLGSVDLSGFDTSSVTDMSGMFAYCSSLASLDLSGFDTSSVNDMAYLIGSCSSLTSVDLSGFDTSSVTRMSGMFYKCSSLASLDLSGFRTSSVTNMFYMFYGCSSLATIYVSERWSTESVSSSDGMFTGCTSLVGGNGTVYDSDHVSSEYARIDTDDTPGYFTYKAYEASSGSTGDSGGSDSDDEESDDDDYGAISGGSVFDDIIDALFSSPLSIDVWKFSNSSDYFTNGYGLTDQDYDKLRLALASRQSELAEVVEIMETELEDWHGSCYGMSSWVVLAALGTRDASDIDGSTDELYDYGNTEDVLSAINFYYLQQFLEPYEDAENDFLSQDEKAKVDELVTLVGTGTPVFLTLRWYAYDEDSSALKTETKEYWTYDALKGEVEKVVETDYDTCGHAVVAYGLEDGDYTEDVNTLLGAQAIDDVEFTHRILIYDCASDLEDETCYLYYADDGTWCIPGHHIICQPGNSEISIQNNAKSGLQYAGSTTDVLNTVDYVSGACEYTGTHSYGSFSSLSTTSYSYDASWASGSASVSGFSVTDSTGDGDVNVAVDANVTADGDTSGSAATTAYLPVAGSYTVTPSDDEVSLYLQGGDYLTSVDADAAGSATFYSDGGAALSTASATGMTISVTANSGASSLPWATVEVTAEDATELTADLTEDGLVITGADVDEVVVTTYEEVGDEGEETAVETDGGAVLVTADDEGAVEADEGYDYTPATDEEREASRTAVTDISEAEVTWKATGYPISDSTFMWYIYNGKARTPGVTVTLNGATLKKGTDYTVSYSSNKSVGTATVTVKGTGAYTGKVTGHFSIYPASNPAKVKKKTATVKYKKLKKKKRTVKAITVTKAKGKVTYKKRGGSKKLSVNKKTGKITVKKGTKKGTYKIKVAVMAYGTWNYAAMTKTVTVKVKVK